MKRLIALVFLVAIVALPTAVLDAQYGGSIDKGGKKERTVPEPSTMLLAGAAAVAGIVAARKARGRNRR